METVSNKMGRMSITLDPDPAAAYYRKKMEQEYGTDSGMLIVGKLLPLNANAAPFNNVNQISAGSTCNPAAEDSDILDESELTYGETACSFGFPYNDHNYACPLGLSPPSSPPHLRDIKSIAHTEDWWLEQEQKRALKQQQMQANKAKRQNLSSSNADKPKKIVSPTPAAKTVIAVDLDEISGRASGENVTSDSTSPVVNAVPINVTSDVSPPSSGKATPPIASTSNTTPNQSTVTVKSTYGNTKFIVMTRNNSTTSLSSTVPTSNLSSSTEDTTTPSTAVPTSLPLTVTSPKPVTPRMSVIPSSLSYSRMATPAEPEQCRVFSLPDHLCISPSALSGLESEDERDDVDTNSIFMVQSQQHPVYDPLVELEDALDETASQSVYSHPDSASINPNAAESEMSDAKQQRYAQNALVMALTRSKRTAVEPSPSASLLPWKTQQQCDEIIKSVEGTGLSNHNSIKCICATQHIDDAMIQCAGCGTWQHFDCIMSPKDERVYHMEDYTCFNCLPQKTCPRRAKQIQKAKLKGDYVSSNLLHELRILPEKDIAAIMATHKLQTNGEEMRSGTPNESGSDVSITNVSAVSSNVKIKVEDIDIPVSCPTEQASEAEAIPNAQPQLTQPIVPVNMSRASRRKQDLTGQRQYMPVAAPPRDLGSTGASKRHSSQASVIGSASLAPPSLVSTPYGLHSHASDAMSTTGSIALSSYNPHVNPLIYPPQSHVKRGRKRLLPKTADETYIRGSSMETLTNPLGTAWMKDYTPIDCNLYSDDVLNYVRENREYNPALVHTVMPPFLLRKPTCRIVIFDHNYKGLEASARILPGETIIEYRGKVMLKEEYEMLKDPIADFNRCVLFYRRLGDVTIAIDAAEVGNEARYIRRSCRPNCEPRHLFVGDELHFHIVSMTELITGVELTIPFDYDYTTCRHHVECACGTSRCPVHRWIRSVQTRRAIPKLDYSKYIKNQLRALSQPLIDIDTSQNVVHPISSSPYSFSAAHSYLQPPVSTRNSYLANNEAFARSRMITQAPLHDPPENDSDENDEDVKPDVDLDQDMPQIVSTSSLSGRPMIMSPHGEVSGSVQHETDLSHEKSGRLPNDSDDPPPFEPIITTRRQMRDVASPSKAKQFDEASIASKRRKK